MRLNHVLVVASDLEATRSFFCDVVGLTDGPRPSFGFAGHWLYDEDHAVVHLAEGSADGRGLVDHVAFDGDDFDGLVERIERGGFDWRESRVPGRDLRQVFVTGPDGVKVEITFPSA